MKQSRKLARSVVGLMCLMASQVASCAAATLPDPEAIKKQLITPDQPKAVEAIRQAFATNASWAATQLADVWIDTLIVNEQFKDATEFLDKSMVTMGGNAMTLFKLQRARVRMLLKAKQPAEALVEAKRLYNVSRMEDTAEALLMVGQAIEAAYPRDPALLLRFKKEQLAGAIVGSDEGTKSRRAGNEGNGASDEGTKSRRAGNEGNGGGAATTRSAGSAAVLSRSDAGEDTRAPTTQAMGGAPMPHPTTGETPVLLGIHAPSEMYDRAAERITGGDYLSLTARGNLLLLADRPKDAAIEFAKAYELAPDALLAQASENVARAMKAEDGTIGRANAWVLSIRPKGK